MNADGRRRGCPAIGGTHRGRQRQYGERGKPTSAALGTVERSDARVLDPPCPRRHAIDRRRHHRGPALDGADVFETVEIIGWSTEAAADRVLGRSRSRFQSPQSKRADQKKAIDF
jgi:hypothetical protein